MKNKELLVHLYEYLENRKLRYVVINILCILYSSFFALLYSYIYKIIFNSVEYGQIETFKKACVLCVVILIADYFSVYLFYYKMKQVRAVVFNVKMKLFHKLTRMDINFFEKNHSGDMLKRLNWDANSLKELYFGGIHRVIAPIVTGIVSLSTMVYYNWRLSICSVIFAVITVQVSLYINKIVRKQNREIQRKLSVLTQRLSDILSGFLVLKLFTGSRLVIDKYNDENEGVKGDTVERAKVLSQMEALTFLTGIVGSFGTMAVGIYLVEKGLIDYGTIMAIVTLQLSLCGTLQQFGGAVANTSSLLACAKRVDDFMGLITEGGLSDSNKSWQESIEKNCQDNLETDNKFNNFSCVKDNSRNTDLNGIEIKDLIFAYDSESEEDKANGSDDENDLKGVKSQYKSNNVDDSEGIKSQGKSNNVDNIRVLDKVSFNVSNGERVMLVGKSGCGKSTILKLLMGFYQKESGSIRIFGKEIEEYSKEELRSLITYVPQESYLFNGTIEENIGFAAPNASHEQIVNAAKLAYADDFINDFKDKYETKLSAGGSNLSGGQRQRVAIARAFLKDAPIILLDEPSSALDAESEGMINKSMKKLMKDKLVIMVTHRTTSFVDFDRVVEIL